MKERKAGGREKEKKRDDIEEGRERGYFGRITWARYKSSKITLN